MEISQDYYRLRERFVDQILKGFTGGSVVKNLPANAGETEDVGDSDLIPGSGSSHGAGNGNPLQYSCLENPTVRGAWQATVHGVSKSQHDWVTEHTHTQEYLKCACICGRREKGWDGERVRERGRERQTDLQSKHWSDLLKNWRFRENRLERGEFRNDHKEKEGPFHCCVTLGKCLYLSDLGFLIRKNEDFLQSFLWAPPCQALITGFSTE